MLKSDTRVVIDSNWTMPLAITFDSHPAPLISRHRVLLAGIIVILLYVLIISEIFHQTIAAMLCAFMSLGCLSLVHDRPPSEVVNLFFYHFCF